MTRVRCVLCCDKLNFWPKSVKLGECENRNLRPELTKAIKQMRHCYNDTKAFQFTVHWMQFIEKTTGGFLHFARLFHLIAFASSVYYCYTFAISLGYT